MLSEEVLECPQIYSVSVPAVESFPFPLSCMPSLYSKSICISVASVTRAPWHLVAHWYSWHFLSFCHLALFGGSDFPLSDPVIFPSVVLSLADVRAALQKGARCHGKLAPLCDSVVESASCSSQPLISVPDTVPRVLIEINSLDTEAHLWCPMVLSHVRTANRIFLNCFPSWDEIFGNQVEHLM